MALMLRLVTLCLPFAACWVAWHERKILRQGVALSPGAINDARRMGVAHPEKIRLLEVKRIPIFNGWPVNLLARWVPAVSPHTVGLCLRYGIYIRAPYQHDRHLIAHECVHTAQYERAGGFSSFLEDYFTGCLRDGYPGSPMEQEAILRAASLED